MNPTQDSLPGSAWSDDAIDDLLERSPKFREECLAIQRRMRAGEYYTHEEVERMLGID